MRTVVVLVLVLVGCVEHGETPSPDATESVDASLDARPDAAIPSCAAVGCDASNVEDPTCFATGALCVCHNPANPAPLTCKP